MTKEKENRFDGLMGAVRGKTNAQTSKHLDAQTSRTKTSQQSSSQSDSSTSEELSIQTSKRSDVQTSRTKTSQQSSATEDAPTSKNPNTSTSKPRNDSDFKSESQAEVHSAHPNIQTSKAKSTNPDYTRTTIYLPKKMHKKLKAIALEEEKEMSSIVEELISAWLNQGS